MVESDKSRFANVNVVSRYPGLERLICAALADTYFAKVLINDPEQALNHIASTINLSQTEYNLALTVTDAKDIHDYAARLYVILKG